MSGDIQRVAGSQSLVIGFRRRGIRGDSLIDPRHAELQWAIAAHRNGNLTGAEATYRKILARRPNYPAALHFFGLLRHQQGQSEAAVDIIRRSLRQSPNNAHALLNLSNVLLALGRVAEARSAYARASSLDAGNADAWFNLGVCLRRVEDPVAACEALERAVGLHERWCMDFVHDALADGRPFRILTVVDQWSRHSPVLEVGAGMSGQRVAEVLERLVVAHGAPQSITVDRGTEFTSRALEDWAWGRGVKLDFIRPGKAHGKQLHRVV